MSSFEDIRSRDYTFEDIVGRTFRGVFGQRFFDFALPAFALALLWFAASTYLTVSSPADLERWIEWMEETETAAEETDPRLPDPPPLPTRGLPLTAACLAIGVVGVQYVLRRIRVSLLEEGESPAQSALTSLDPLRFLDFVLSGAVATVAIAVGTLLCFLPGLALSFVFALLPACLTFGEGRFRVPVAEPFRLVRRRFWKTIGVLVVLSLVVLVAGAMVTMPLNGLFLRSVPDPGTAAESPEAWRAMMEAMVEWSTSPAGIALGIVSTLVGTLSWLIFGFATVVMYVNYSAVPPHSGAAPVVAAPLPVLGKGPERSTDSPGERAGPEGS